MKKTPSIDNILTNLNKCKIFTKNDPLLSQINITKNIKQVDAHNQTILHQFIQGVNARKITDRYELNELIEMASDLAYLIGDRALNLPDKNGFSALDLATNCKVLEICYASLMMPIPIDATPYSFDVPENGCYYKVDGTTNGNITNKKCSFDRKTPETDSMHNSVVVKAIGDLFESDFYD